jgi:diguanylate cyclase (GGDEF)-like protein
MVKQRPLQTSAPEPAAAPSDPAQLAAEVVRLEAELATLRARVAELETHAERDPLTGLLNRRGFERELTRARSYVERYGGNAALVYFDLDGFKPVNDRHGHAAGDAVLMGIAAALSNAVRASDAVARLGGDEFTVLLWNLSERDAQKKAFALERLIAETPIAWDGNVLAVGASAGVAEFSHQEEPAALVARADAGMYARKRERKGE